MRRLFTLISILVMVFSGGYSYALSTDQIKALQSGIYYVNTEDTVCSTTTLVGSDNQQQAFNYFRGKGLTEIQAAAILGNLMQESHINPKAIQSDNVGHGIAQWETPGRWDSLLKFADSKGGDPYSLSVQLDYMWVELNDNRITALNKLKEISTLVDSPMSDTTLNALNTATGLFETWYEGAGKPLLTNRQAFALAILQNYSGSDITASIVSAGGCVSNCIPNTTSINSGLSAVRTAVVCHAQEELTRWVAPSFDLEYYKNYSQKRVENWCADFASWVYDQAGYPLKPDPKWNTPGVYEVKQIGDQNQNFHYYDSASYTPRPGDLAIHSTGDNLYYHVNVVVDVTPITKLVTLIGGNQGGTPGSDLGGATSVNTARVSEYTQTGYSTDNVIGYVSPD